jgi:hypothetical protein
MFGDLIGHVCIIADELPASATVADLDQAVRTAFRTAVGRKCYLNGIQAVIDKKQPSHPGGVFFDVSNVGAFETTGPFVDAFGQVTGNVHIWSEFISLSSITLFGGQNDRLTLRYPYSQLVLTRTDAVKGLKGVVHSLQKISPKMKVADAIRELREVTA